MEMARKFLYIISRDHPVKESAVNRICFLILKLSYLYWIFEVFVSFGRVLYTFLPPRLDRNAWTAFLKKTFREKNDLFKW